MSITKHTAEPWKLAEAHVGMIMSDTSGVIAWVTRGEEANASRIVACVNALAGIDDPAVFMEKVRQAVRMQDRINRGSGPVLRQEAQGCRDLMVEILRALGG